MVTEPPKKRIHAVLPTVFFLVVQIFIFFEFYRSPKAASDIFWYCNHISLLYMIAFALRRTQMVIGLMCVGIVIQLLWLVDFIGHLFGINIMNAADYMFVGSFDYIKIVTLVVHMLIPGAVLYWIGGIQPKVHALGYAFLYIVPVYILTLLFSTRPENINCVFAPCAAFVPHAVYVALWPVYAFGVTALTFLFFYVATRLVHYVKRQALQRPVI